LAFAVLLIAGARLGDILGRRRLFLVGSATPPSPFITMTGAR
jgi:hypothetical protein